MAGFDVSTGIADEQFVSTVVTASSGSMAEGDTGGMHVPGVLGAGTFHRRGDRVFWALHDAEKAGAILFKDGQCARFVVEVADPAATVAAIATAIHVPTASH